MSEQQSPALQAYAEASQACRDIGARVGVRNCDDDADWTAAERRANDLFVKAEAAGHSVDEILKAGRKQ
ncbi:hypothetical protein AQI95_24745 [Streptomyces yokosukanensis]|uniref:Uncharacterized protein n=1 Tax=Streptomyces yokosukanensis TaxID=67386 RepID=A0A101P1H2_9ACTN|nr:hypothetical protein [Streptomyces yokosukanensis]KUN03168.1 hypothetical protein AQI95_24745 [Streptomyces yokosukanensis]